MFHIKTDIRQYKCESEQKVERLIRNWVIRPNDLIYDAQKDAWESIGEHVAFHALFVTIENEEANEPDTVVTEAPSAIAAEYEVRPGSELEGEASDADQTLTFDKSAVDDASKADEDLSDPSPPEAPAGVEGLIRDSDEITMMTDRTLNMLRDGASEPSTDAAPAGRMSDLAASDAGPAATSDTEKPPPQGRHGLPEDVFITDEIYREEIDASIRDDLKALDDTHDAGEECAADEDEVTQLVERSAFGDADQDAQAPVTAALPSEAAEREPVDDASANAATPDVPLQEDESALASTDEREPDVASTADATDKEADSEENTGWRITLAENKDGDSAQEDEQVSAEEQAALEAFDDYQAMDDAELDAMLNEAAALVGLGNGQADEDLLDRDASESDAPDADVDPDEPISEEDENSDARDRAKTPVGAPLDPMADISGGYALPLPLDVSPSAAAIKRGLVRSRLSRELKNATFPHPSPRTPGEVVTRTFDLSPAVAESSPELQPPDHSLRYLILGVLLLALTIFGAIIFFE